MTKDKELSTTRTSAALMNWEDKKMQAQIRESYGKGLNDGEWNMFLGLGMATKLNPFLREIWCVKYGNNAAAFFIGRDGYRRSAQAHPEYEYHFVDAVYKNDKIKMTNGELTHEYSLADRGELIGAYCIVKRKSSSKPVFNYVELKEYKQTYGVWPTKPATMIKKVAEAQGLRGSFQELFSGTFEESENWKAPEETATDKKNIVEVSAAPSGSEVTTGSEAEAEVISYLENAKSREDVAQIIKEMIATRTWTGDQARRINQKVADTAKKFQSPPPPTPERKPEEAVADAVAIFNGGEVTRESREEMLEDMKSDDLNPIVLRCNPKSSPKTMKKREKIEFILSIEFPPQQSSIPVPKHVPSPAAPTTMLDDLFAAGR